MTHETYAEVEADRPGEPPSDRQARPRMLEILSLTHCLQRLGCTESETSGLVFEWISSPSAPVVVHVRGGRERVLAGCAA